MSEALIITGGAGFIGSNFVHYYLKQRTGPVVVIDKLTYAGNPANLDPIRQDPRFTFVEADIVDEKAMEAVFREHKPAAIINFAAESHVDRSIEGPADFVETNFVGVFNLLEVLRRYFATLSEAEQKRFRFLQVSTDEVYGSLGETGAFLESTPYDPQSPYSATKAAADHLVVAYLNTYKLPTLITNCSNNYGPYQFPEKLIPLMILNALQGRDLPIYGDGGNIRDWLYVEDHCAGILLALEKGGLGEKYNIGGNNERKNIEIVDRICDVLDELKPVADNEALSSRGLRSYRDLKTYVQDRPGHDRRYAIDATRIREELGWEPAHNFETGIVSTIQWYLDHLDWCEAIESHKYDRERLGLSGDEKGRKE